jgi:hypothetical protein
MANSRLINTNFWKDTYVIDLDPIEKLMFLYFLTNPNTNLAGAYEISLRQVAFDTGIDKDMVEKILRRFCLDEKMYYEKGWLVLRNFIKHQRLNPSMKIGIEKQLTELPDWLRERIVQIEEDNQLSLLVESEKPDSPQSVHKVYPIKSNIIKLNKIKSNDFDDDKKIATSSSTKDKVKLKTESGEQIDIRSTKGYEIFQKKRKELAAKKSVRK